MRILINKLRFFFSVFALLLSCPQIFADVAPDPGQVRVNPPLVFSALEDFPDYRFFLASPIDIEEISIKKGETKTIDATNRGGAKRFAALIALPRAAISQYPAPLIDDDSKKLFRAFNESSIPGAIELVKHSFQKDIPQREKDSWKYPLYQIQREGNSLRAATADPEEKQAGNANNKAASNIENESQGGPNSGFGLFTIIAGLFLSLAAIAGGILIFRKIIRN